MSIKNIPPRLRVVNDLLIPRSSERILDVGCGKGPYESYCKCRNIIGIDISRMDILEATRRSSADFIVASATNLPFKANSFDKIIAAEVIEHLPACMVRFSLQEMHRVLDSDGCLAITTPSYHFYYNILDPGYLFFHHRHYKSSELISLVKGSFFNLEVMFQRGTVIYAVVMFLHSIFIGFFHRLLKKPTPKSVERVLKFLERKTVRDFYKNRENGYTWFLRLSK